MKETSDILAAWRQCRRQGEACALATVVRLSGSGYRRPGARMLILGDGRSVGSISGGCLERDVIYRAGAAIAGGEAVLVRYDAMSEEEAGPGASLGCGGTIDILIERAGDACMEKLQWLAASRRRGAIVTVIARKNIPIELAARLALDETGQVQFDAAEVHPLMLDEARAAIETAQSREFRHSDPDGWMDLFVEYVDPPLELLIFGGGGDTAPLAELGRMLGWHVSVTDLRRSPALLEELEIPAQCAAVVMNHNWKHDLAVLRKFAAANPKYLGVLGPRRRTERLLARLGEAAPMAEQMHFPVGLDIGAETPQEVALAIVAEITSVLHGAAGGPLRDKSGSIHPPQESYHPQEPPISCPIAAS